MDLYHTVAIFIPMRAKTFVWNVLKRLEARARGPKGFETHCFNQYDRCVTKDHDQ